MIHPIIYNIKDSFEHPTPYYVDDACNVYICNGPFDYTPIHVYKRKKDGRPVVYLNLDGTKTKGYLVYRLLMRAVYNIPNEEFGNYVVDHLDCDTTHNTFTNFELVTQAENMRRAAENNRMPSGEDHHNSKYSDALIESICQDICENLSRKDIMNRRSVNGQLIDDIRSGRSHRNISIKYLDKGFSYKTYDRSEKVEKAIRVCQLLQEGYTVPQVSSMTGYGRNFVEPIFNKRTFKDVSIDYDF